MCSLEVLKERIDNNNKQNIERVSTYEKQNTKEHKAVADELKSVAKDVTAIKLLLE